MIIIQVKWKCCRPGILFRIDIVRFYAFRVPIGFDRRTDVGSSLKIGRRTDAVFPLKIVRISCRDGFNFFLQFHVISISIREYTASEDRRRRLLGGFVCFNKTRKHPMSWSTSNDAHIGGRAERQGGLKLAAMEDKKYLIAVVGRVGATMVLDLLTVVLRGQ